jgi:competence protein ComGC
MIIILFISLLVLLQIDEVVKNYDKKRNLGMLEK